MRDRFLVFGAPLIEDAEIAEVVDSLRSGWLGTGRADTGIVKRPGDRSVRARSLTGPTACGKINRFHP